MARERDDEFEDEGDERPARRSRGDIVEKPGGLDGFLGNLPVAIIVAVITGLCCACIPLILGGVGMATCKTPEGKKGALFTLIIGIVWLVINIVLSATGVVDVKQFQGK